MTQTDSSAGWPEDFCGRVRLFPLPNLVMFPNVVQPLHIFEPRYCEMLEDALSTDRLIAMVLLQKGWENSYLRQPAIAQTVCVGKIISHTPTEDGRHNILLVGMKRARIIEELEEPHAFRTAKVDLIEEVYAEDDSGEHKKLMDRLTGLFSEFVPEGIAAQESFQELVGQQLPLGILTDTITYAMNLPLDIKQQLLAEPQVEIRCRILLKCLERMVSDKSSSVDNDDGSEGFPPPFSNN